ncbi:MAG: hypothetical protein ACFCVK_04540 [Acidimicrobiales bacterium]
MEAELLRVVVAALDRAGIAHMVTGSLASTIHGQPRATRAIDLVIDPTEASIDLLVAEFPTERFYVGDAGLAFARRDMFNVVDVRSGWKVDLIVLEDRPFSRTEFQRRQPAEVAGVSTYIVSAEDSILSKLEWHSMSGSDNQRRDVLEMLVANRDHLDHAYLERWATELAVVDVLHELQAEAAATGQ